MLRITEPLSTERLLLRPFTSEDVEDVWAYQRRPVVARYMRWEPRDRRQSQEAVDQMAGEVQLAEEGDCLSLAVVSPDHGKVIGQVELVWLGEEDRQGEIGCVFNPDYQGKGLATEAASAALRLGFDELGLHRIIGRCHAGNSASARLMERMGMRREAHFIDTGIFKGAWREDYVYAMLRHEWRARRAGA
ncbi:RimJ/RimL family protein N-acetyltransferase [Streptomyces olivoverticillatus]|uniref:RimJ/RimL family protein N-acetyltransferase n=1 Tax=Streptomyces olivoverticillatus TaxID=66427 RepID=A0A7W7LQ09_9ACTN|nr:GNAT family protein [Streptomyces olivoverticillatus]MBB4893641.1 RimJ/RimL family protein N-acetyltransferase [Streptomyces olivoverticillatus]